MFLPQKPIKENQAIDLPGVPNARELGGYRTIYGTQVKKGVLIRTGMLSGATDEAIRKLTKEIRPYRVVDLRTSFEARKNPDPKLRGIKCVNLSPLGFSLPLLKYGLCPQRRHGREHGPEARHRVPGPRHQPPRH